MTAAIAALAIVCMTAVAVADAEAAFTAIGRRVATGELAVPAAIAEFEALGAARPASRWTDDAWAEAARLAERVGDYGRARRDLEQVIAIGDDARLVARARSGIDRLAGVGGTTGQWDAVAKAHDGLVARIIAGGDPKPALRELEALVRTNPGYLRGVAARLVLARSWEADGDPERAIRWLRDAVAVAPNATERLHASIALARILVRHDPGAAPAAIAQVTDPLMRATITTELARVARRTWFHRAAWLALALAVIAGLGAGRRLAGSWRAMLRALGRPPIEVVFIAPIALVIAGVAQTGNPLVAHAVWLIALTGIAIAWTSGAFLEVARRRGPISTRRAIAHAALGLVAATSVAYLALDRGNLRSMVVETWRAGPQR